MTTKKMQQEFFEITENNGFSRARVIRQDRLPTEPQEVFLLINSIQFEVHNLSSFGVAIHANPRFEDKSDTAFSADLIYRDKKIQSLWLRFVRENDEIIAFESIQDAVQVDLIKALRKSYELIESFSSEKKSLAKLPSDFMKLTLEMKESLESLKKHLDNVEKSMTYESISENQLYRATLVESVASQLGKYIPDIYMKLPQTLQNTSEETRDIATKYIREKLGPFVYGAPFAARAYYKPRGYAGDYEMMNHLYRDEMAGASLFDQCMHKYFIDEPAGQAVKNRGQYLFNKLQTLLQNSKNKPLKIASIASGPAMEVQLLLKNLLQIPHTSQNIEFHFFDQDEESLKHAQKQIRTIDKFTKSGFSFYFHHLAIKNIIAQGLPIKNCDLVYSAGLFDYFTDPVAQLAAQKFLEACNSDGSTIIGNFSTLNPCVPFMEMVLDWHLIYRSEEDLHRIFKPVSGKVSVESEPLAINIFAVLKK